MRSVSTRFLRIAVFVTVLTAIGANGAFAGPRDGRDDGWLARFHRLAHLIVATISDQLGSPPG